MSREDFTSAVLLLLLSVLLWWSGLGRNRDAALLRTESPATVNDDADPLFRGRGVSFHISCPPEWVWEAAQPEAPGDDGWELLGRFVVPQREFVVTTRWLDRDVDILLLLDHEVKRMRWSIEKMLPPDGRRPRVAVARLWRCRDGQTETGWLGLICAGSRWFRVVAWVDPELADAGMTTALEAIRSLQPASRSCVTHAEARCRWRPALGGGLAVAYPASWSRQSEGDDGAAHLLHLRSRSKGRVRGILTLCASGSPPDDAALLKRWIALEPEFVAVGATEANRAPDSALLQVRHGGSGEVWWLYRRRVQRMNGGLTVLLATPDLSVDPWAGLCNLTAYESVCGSVVWER